MDRAQIKIEENADAMALTAAQMITDAARSAVEARGRFTIALAGGSTPELAYLNLSATPFKEQIDWTKFFALFGDERFVPADDNRANLAMAARTLLTRVPIPYGNVLPILTCAPTAEDGANDYSRKISGLFGRAEKSSPPQIDLFLLGIGDDGHTASIFPGKPSVQEKDKWFVASPPGTLPPPVDRITATLPLINAARSVIFLAAGKKKAAIIKEVFENPDAARLYPAAMVQPKEGDLIWMLDKESASSLKQEKQD